MAKSQKSNLRLAGVFIFFVSGLIIASFFIKVLFIFKDSSFDGKHEYNIAIVSDGTTNIASLAPATRTIAILNVNSKEGERELSKNLKIPIDGEITIKTAVTKDNLQSTFLKSIVPFGSRVKGMNIADLINIFLYSRSVPFNSIYQRSFSENLNSQQKSTLISLTFTDPTIYQENLSIEIVNATSEFGLGTKLANLVTNIGGNVILVTSPENISNHSQIVYFGKKTYTVDRLHQILNYEVSKSDKKSIADVIIIIGKDSLSKNNF